MCVEALAATLGKNIIDVSYAEIESKYVGETGKNIVAAFKTAKQTGAILFFDEADSILGKRMTNVTQAADHGVNVARAVMLKQLDAFDGIVAFATNLAKNFDGAFVRRILLHIEIPLPDESGRLQMWRKMIGCRIPGYEELDLQLLAKESSGLSGGDIKNAVVTSFALTASRLEYERRITTSDISSTVQQLRKARNEMGTKPLVVKEEVLNA
jgi:SpoVK/Ycf46/Vps4 family AAA+-type ATPase